MAVLQVFVMRYCFFVLFFVLCLLFGNPFVWAQETKQTINTLHTKASLVASTETVTAGQKLEIALNLTLEKGWHTYWENAGDSGLPATITWALPTGARADALRFPTPTLIPIPPLVSYGYDAPVTLLTTITLPKKISTDALEGASKNPFIGTSGEKENFSETQAYVPVRAASDKFSDAANRPRKEVFRDALKLKATATWLVCKDICIPEQATFTLFLPVTGTAPIPSTTAEDLFSAAYAALPTPMHTPISYKTDTKNILFSMPNTVFANATSGMLFLKQNGVAENVAKQLFIQTTDAYIFTLPLVAPPRNAELDGVVTLKTEAGQQRSFSFRAAHVTAKNDASAQKPLSFWLAMAFAFLGGIILNLMPCVFPVLALKAISLSKLNHKTAVNARKEGWAYTLGIITAFVIFGGIVLYLQHTAEAVGWGFQLQSPAFVMALTFLFVALGLNLLGVFSLPTLLGGLANNVTQEDTLKSSFFLGMIAAVVATPCTAPFMAAALGYALVHPPLEAFSVIVALGLGLASPYVLITQSAWLRQKMPRSGSWMERLKHWLALPMFATALWLLYVLQQQSVLALFKTLVGVIVLVLGILLLHRRNNRFYALFIFMILGGLGGLIVTTPPLPVKTTSVFSPADIATFAKTQPVFVDVTAAWCITCKINERLTLKNDRVMTAFQKKNVRVIVLDWTNRDAAISAYLQQFQRSGVPLYVYYPLDKQPIVLPQILTPDGVIETLR